MPSPLHIGSCYFTAIRTDLEEQRSAADVPACCVIPAEQPAHKHSFSGTEGEEVNGLLFITRSFHDLALKTECSKEPLPKSIGCCAAWDSFHVRQTSTDFWWLLALANAIHQSSLTTEKLNHNLALVKLFLRLVHQHCAYADYCFYQRSASCSISPHYKPSSPRGQTFCEKKITLT